MIETEFSNWLFNRVLGTHLRNTAHMSRPKQTMLCSRFLQSAKNMQYKNKYCEETKKLTKNTKFMPNYIIYICETRVHCFVIDFCNDEDWFFHHHRNPCFYFFIWWIELIIPEFWYLLLAPDMSFDLAHVWLDLGKY